VKRVQRRQLGTDHPGEKNTADKNRKGGRKTNAAHTHVPKSGGKRRASPGTERTKNRENVHQKNKKEALYPYSREYAWQRMRRRKQSQSGRQIKQNKYNRTPRKERRKDGKEQGKEGRKTGKINKKHTGRTKTKTRRVEEKKKGTLQKDNRKTCSRQGGHASRVNFAGGRSKKQLKN